MQGSSGITLLIPSSPHAAEDNLSLVVMMILVMILVMMMTRRRDPGAETMGTVSPA